MSTCDRCGGSGVDYWGKGCVTCGGRGRVLSRWPESYSPAGLCIQCGRCAGCHRGPDETSCKFAALVTCGTGTCPPQYRERPHRACAVVTAMDRRLFVAADADREPCVWIETRRGFPEPLLRRCDLPVSGRELLWSRVVRGLPAAPPVVDLVVLGKALKPDER